MKSQSTNEFAPSEVNGGRTEAPILLLIFNRPDTTKAVMESIRRARPERLFIAADGPRASAPGEERLCEEARRHAANVDWPCEVQTLFRGENAGCAINVSSAISWFFEHVEEGIVLEDDCVAGESFYPFCTELLAYYRHTPEVMHIAGTSFQYGRRRGRASYYLSRYPNLWGWATWRRAWRMYDFSLRPSWKLEDTWGTQWQLSIEKHNGLAVVPNRNLVKNIGFGEAATHTRGPLRPSKLVIEEMAFPLTHPKELVPDKAADTFTYYAHHRLVPHLGLIWLYRLQDYLRFRLKPIKRRVLGKLR